MLFLEIVGVGIVLGLLAVYIISSQAKKEFNKIVSMQKQDSRKDEVFTSDDSGNLSESNPV